MAVKLYYVVQDSGPNRILWDGVTRFEPGANWRILTETEKTVWETANPKPVYDAATQKIRVNIVSGTWEIVPLNQIELEEVADKVSRNQIRNLLAKLDARTASNAEIQTAIAAIVRRIV